MSHFGHILTSWPNGKRGPLDLLGFLQSPGVSCWLRFPPLFALTALLLCCVGFAMRKCMLDVIHLKLSCVFFCVESAQKPQQNANVVLWYKQRSPW